MKETFVITYTELGQWHKVVWDGESAKDALQTFWKSYEYGNEENVSNVKIYSLTLVEMDTDFSIIYK